MSINLLKKLVSSVVQPEIANPSQRKPPQRAHTVDNPPEQTAKFSGSGTSEHLPKNDGKKMLIPKTWNEVIGNPRIWAEVRPLIVDED